MPELLRDLGDNLVGWESKTVRTIRDLTIRPGHLACDYVEGRRHRYVNPVRYLLVMTALLWVAGAAAPVPWTDGIAGLIDSLIDGWNGAGWGGRVESVPGDGAWGEGSWGDRMAPDIAAKLGSYSKVTFLLLLPVLAALLRRMPSGGRNYAETLAAVSYWLGHCAWIQAIGLIVLWLVPMAGAATMTVVAIVGGTMLAYVPWACMGFFTSARFRTLVTTFVVWFVWLLFIVPAGALTILLLSH